MEQVKIDICAWDSFGGRHHWEVRNMKLELRKELLAGDTDPKITMESCR